MSFVSCFLFLSPGHLISPEKIFSNAVFWGVANIITVEDNIFAVLLLIISFLFVAALLICLNCDFLGLIFVLLYVGAIAVLLLFILMMLDVKWNKLSLNKYNVSAKMFVYVSFFFCLASNIYFFFMSKKTFIFWNTLDYAILLLIVFPSLISLFPFLWIKIKVLIDFFDSTANIKVYGQIFYNSYVFHFLISGMLLLLALSGAVHFTVLQIENFRIFAFAQFARGARFLQW